MDTHTYRGEEGIGILIVGYANLHVVFPFADIFGSRKKKFLRKKYCPQIMSHSTFCTFLPDKSTLNFISIIFHLSSSSDGNNFIENT